MKRYLTLLPTLLIAFGALSQTTSNDTINRMVLVESTYNPIIAGAAKRQFLPDEVEPSMKKEDIVYADGSLPFSQFKRTARVVEGMPVAQEKGLPGYVHLGYGNYNNLNALAAYRLHLKEHHSLSFKAHTDGWYGKLPLLGSSKSKWRSYLYDMGGDAAYRMAYDNIELGADLSAAYHTYNYRTVFATNPFRGVENQASNRLNGSFYVKGDVEDRYHYQARMAYTHFGRTAYDGLSLAHSEGHLHGEIAMGADLNEWGSASLALCSDQLSYRGLGDYGYASRLYFGLTPSWSIDYRDFRFTAGFHIDWSTGNDATLWASPACAIQYTPGKRFAIDLTLDGGRQLSTFSRLYALSPYWSTDGQLPDSYTLLDAQLAGNIRITEGLHLHVGGGYKITDNALFETLMWHESACNLYTGVVAHDAQMAHAHAKLSYTDKDRLTLYAEGRYNHWMLKDAEWLLAHVPQVEAKGGAKVRIIENLHVSTDVRYVMFSAAMEQYLPAGAEMVMQREAPILDWGLSARYTLNDRLSFFAEGHNLLNRRYQHYYGYTAQGIHGLAGAVFKF